MIGVGHAGFSSLSAPVNSALTSFLPSVVSNIQPSHSPSHLFPLPLASFPPRPVSGSRRVHQVHARACRVVALANDTLRALNTLFFNYPSPRFIRQLCLRSTVPSNAQRRIRASVLSAAATYFYSCRRLCKQSSSGQPASVRTAPRTGSSPNSRVVESSSSSSLVVLPPRPLRPAPLTSQVGGDSLPDVPLGEPALDLSAALRAFDTVEPASALSVGLPSSYDSSSGVLPIVADRVALPDNLQHVSILDTLPSPIAAHYSDPEALLLPRQVVADRVRQARLRKPRVLAARGEYVKLVRRMLGLGMLQLTTEPQCVNSLFGVPKGADTRLILDARLANCHFADAPPVRLPSPSHLAQLQATGAFVVAKMDLSNFYHQLVLPAWIRPYFALPALTLSEQAALAENVELPASVRAALSSANRLFPCCVTLPMGFSHSVFLAQCVHEHVLYSSSCLSPRDNLLNLLSPVIDRPLHGLYVDDCVLLGPDERGVRRQYESVLNAYSAALLPVKRSKCTEATAEPVTVLGVDVCGASQTIALSMERHARIVRSTAALIAQPLVAARELARVLGAWTWELLLRRPALAALKHCYRFVERSMLRPARPLWPSVVRELSVLTMLSPLLTVNMRASWAGHLVATDASMDAAGVVTTPLRADTLRSLWPLSALHLPSLLQQTQSPAPPLPVKLTQPCLDACPPPHTIAAVQRALQQVRWRTLVSQAWGREEHINCLELEAMQLGVRWHASRPASFGTRLPLLVDSSAAYGIARKGRTAASSLLSTFRRTAAVTLATDTVLVPMWLPSHLNPADAPSRSQQALASGCLQLATAP